MTPPALTLVVDLYDGAGRPVTEGTAELAPTEVLTDVADQMRIIRAPVRVAFGDWGPSPAQIIPTDAPGPKPAGWAWRIRFRDVPGSPPPSCFLAPAGPADFTCAGGADFQWTPTDVFTAAGLVPLPPGTGVQLSGSSLPGGFLPGVTYFAVSSAGPSFQLAATDGGAPLTASSPGGGTLAVTLYRFSALAPVMPVTSELAAYAQLGGDLSGVPARLLRIQGTPVAPPTGNPGEYLNAQGGWTTPDSSLGDKSFTMPFPVTDTVAVPHNLGKRPAVTVTDSAGYEMHCPALHVDLNNLILTFSAPFSGRVTCN